MTITNNLLKDLCLDNYENIIVGVSGGPDSMALLHYLIRNCDKKIICAHINHKVRKESDEEELYVKKYCEKNNIIFESIKLNNWTENNFENEARHKRYNFYEKLMKKYYTKYLFLAHHGDDLIETILMKIERGSDLEGYAGFKKIGYNNKYYIIRPFIEYTKGDLLNYCEQYGIKYYVDKTNFSNKYTRNRHRNTVLPLLKKEDSIIHIKFYKYSNILHEYDDYIKRTIEKTIPNIYKKNILNINKFIKEDPFIQKHIIYYILKQIYNNASGIIKEKHINNIQNIIYNDKPNLIQNLPNNVIVKKEYNNLYFNLNNTFQNNYKIKLDKENIINNHIIKIIDDCLEDGNDICRLNSKNLKMPLYIRNKKIGDIIKVKGLNGSKKIKDIFINEKVPTSLRDNYPVIVDNDDNILWIPNLKKSIYNIEKNNIYDIILKDCERNDYIEKQQKF